jgi:DNA-binding NarL/FixJ family response regulator
LLGKGFAGSVAVHIAVVDPLPLFREGAAVALRAAGHTVEMPDDIVTWVRQRTDALVLLTVMSEHDWELLARLHTTSSPVVITLLTVDSAVLGARAVRAGARSVLPRNVTDAVLRRTVEATIGGQAVLPAAVAAVLTDQSEAVHGLSVDQVSWLRQLANGSTVAQLADRAGYSERAMFRLLQALYRQIGVRGRIQAIIRAQEAGWL